MTTTTTRPDAFETARAGWLRARAVLAECDADALNQLPDDEADKATNAALNALGAAEWRLLRTPAKTLDDIRERAEIVLDEMFAAADKVGAPTDNRHKLMLSALVSEILNYNHAA